MIDDSYLKNGTSIVCKFGQHGGKVLKVTAKASFKINDFGLSTVAAIGGINVNDNKRRVISGDYQISDQCS